MSSSRAITARAFSADPSVSASIEARICFSTSEPIRMRRRLRPSSRSAKCSFIVFSSSSGFPGVPSKRHAKSAPLPRLAHDRDLRAVQLRELLDDREAETRSRPDLGARSVHLVETLKDPVLFRQRDSRPVVLDDERRPPIHSIDPDSYVAA